MLPEGLLPPDGRSCSSDNAVTDLPEPDSPTSASVSPRSSVKDTPSTTRLAPNATDRFATVTRLMAKRCRGAACPCHCEERSDAAISIGRCARNWMEIAASLRSSQ